MTHFTGYHRLFHNIKKMFCTYTNPASKSEKIICIEGNIGVGKSTFLKMFENEPVSVIMEPVNQWRDVQGHNLLEFGYADPKRWAFLIQSYIQLTFLKQKNSQSYFDQKICERSIYSARYCFVENLKRSGSLSGEEVAVLDSWFDYIIKNLLDPIDLIVYLRCDPQTCFSRVKSRGRIEERNINIDLMQRLHDLHELWLIKNEFPVPAPVIIVDANKSINQLLKEVEELKPKILSITNKNKQNQKMI